MKPMTCTVGILLALCSWTLTFSAEASATGDANQASCPSQTEGSSGFRSTLPDCRAYEMVTPAAKNGQPPVTNKLALAADGEHLSFSSIGAFDEPGNVSTAEGGEYIASRGLGGWTVKPVNPSAQEFQDGSPEIESNSHETLDFSADLDHSLFLKAPLGAKPIDTRFYRSDVATGELTEIGGVISPEAVEGWTRAGVKAGNFPPTQYVGASQDLQDIFFSQGTRDPEAQTWLWPGDETLKQAGARSLYEYAGASPEPELVGVRNATSLAVAAAEQHKTHINEAAELISHCGTALGGIVGQVRSANTEDTYNAVSSSGDVVYFSVVPCEAGAPEVGEVYARIGRSHTVAISQPTIGPTGDCEHCSLVEPKEAIFQGASEDGTKAYFLSEEKLFSGTRGESGVNLYMFNLDGPSHNDVTLVGHDLPMAEGFPAGVVRVSETGEYVYFVSHAVLAANQSQTGEEAVAGEDQYNLYVYDHAAGRTSFISRLSEQDKTDWKTRDENRHAEATPDGRFLLFASTGKLTKDAEGESNQLYRYEAPRAGSENGSLTRITVGATGEYECPLTKTVEVGYGCNGNATAVTGPYAPQYGRNGERAYTQPNWVSGASVGMTNDGSTVFFQTPTGLTPTALNDVCGQESFGSCQAAAGNVYEWKAGHVYLLSDGQDTNVFLTETATKLVGADPSGANVFITSASPLVPSDTDTQADLYDVRTDGGFSNPAVVVPCTVECQPGVSNPPGFASSATTGMFGEGDITPTTRPPVAKPAARRQPTRRQLLAQALRRCRGKAGTKRQACERHARKRYAIREQRQPKRGR